MNKSVLPTAPPPDTYNEASPQNSFTEAPPPYSTFGPNTSFNPSPFSSPANKNPAHSYHHGNTKLCHIDFLPRLIKKKLFGRDQYECFSDLILRVNAWLCDHSDSCILNIESVTWFDTNVKNIFTDDTSLIKNGINIYLKGLRLWYIMPLVPFVGVDESHQTIHCITHPHKPTQTITQLFSTINYYLNSTKSGAVNGGGGGGVGVNGGVGGGGGDGGVVGDSGDGGIESHLKNIPKGRVLSIETVEMSCVDGLLETEETQSKYSTGDTRYVFMAVRVYIIEEEMSHEYQTIEYQDFIPGRTNRNKENKGYELFTDVMDRGARWVARKPGVQVLNTQCLSVKLKKDIPTPERVRYKDHCSNLLKVVRTYFTIQHPPSPNPQPETRLSCRTFKPNLNKKSDKYENMRSLTDRINKWIQLTGAKVKSVETLLVQSNNLLGSEATVLANRDVDNQLGRYVFLVRLYLDGDYNEASSAATLLL